MTSSMHTVHAEISASVPAAAVKQFTCQLIGNDHLDHFAVLDCVLGRFLQHAILSNGATGSRLR